MAEGARMRQPGPSLRPIPPQTADLHPAAGVQPECLCLPSVASRKPGGLASPRTPTYLAS